MSVPVTRREFLGTTMAVAALGALGQAAPGALPQRPFGRTGMTVPVLAFGCGSRFLAYKDPNEALGVLEHVIDQGVTYLDTATSYGNGESERRIGMLMGRRRRDVILATKIPDSMRTRDAALKAVEASLERLQTDRLDVLHLHSLGNEDDLAAMERPDGAIKALYELRDQKVARAVGMTSHTNGLVMARAIERHDLDCVQIAMNPARALDFEDHALPAAVKKQLGIVVMKVTGQEKLVGAGAGQADMTSLVRYALSLPVSTAVIGMPRREFIAENLALAKAFTPMSPAEMDRVRQRVAPAQASVAAFFANHADA
jgi:uncharacterized protein